MPVSLNSRLRAQGNDRHICNADRHAAGWFGISDLAQVGHSKRETPQSRLSLARLLAKSPVMLPIAGTQSIEHLEDNVLAAGLKLEPDDFDDLQCFLKRDRFEMLNF